MKTIIPNFDEIPNYLTKQNQYFQEFIRTALPTIGITNGNEYTDRLRKIAIVIYKIMLIQMYQDLWTIYLKSGTGQLFNDSKLTVNYSTNISIWPKDIKQQIDSTTIQGINLNDVYLKFVQLNLHDLNHHLKHYQTTLNINANMFKNYSLDFQNLIENYIKEHFSLLRMYVEHQMELVHCDYHIHAIKVEFLRQHPNPSQVNFYILLEFITFYLVIFI